MNGPQPISMSDLYAMTQLRHIDRSDDLEFLLMAIPEMDRIYLEHSYAEKEKKTKAAEKKKPPQGRRR